MTGSDPGLLITGTAVAIVLAYTVRFFAIAQGARARGVRRACRRRLPWAARSLGRTRAGALRDVYLPMIRGSVGDRLSLRASWIA